MADSVDRVFVHALNTVKRIRSARPPPADRLRLYGLYKQSMEGDVDGVMDRPRGDGDEIRADQDKWDAWDRQKGLSRTEAKRRYIETLIQTMRRYASQTPEARELVAELDFVWDQIKSNSPSSSSSNSYPLQPPPVATLPQPSPIALIPGMFPITQNPVTPPNEAEDDEQPPLNDPETPGPEIFVDAREDSQPDLDYDLNDGDGHTPSEPANSSIESPTPAARQAQTRPYTTRPRLHPQKISLPAAALQPPALTTHTQHPHPPTDLQSKANAFILPLTNYLSKKSPAKPTSSGAAIPPPSSTSNAATAAALAAQQKWQKRIETSLIQMTAEMAALREQLEMQHQASSSALNLLHPFSSRRSIAGTAVRGFSPPPSPLWSSPKRTVVMLLIGFVRGLVSTVARTVAVDVFVLVCVFAFLRFRRGLDAQGSQAVFLQWMGRVADTVRVRSRGMERALDIAGQSLKVPFEIGPRMLAESVRVVRRSGVRFLDARRRR